MVGLGRIPLDTSRVYRHLSTGCMDTLSGDVRLVDRTTGFWLANRHLVDLAFVEKLAKEGESETLEFKASTNSSLLRRGFETLCGFLNGTGGHVLVGVKSNGQVVGQQVSDQTRQEISTLLVLIEPSPSIVVSYAPVAPDKNVIVFTAVPSAENRPYTFDGKPFVRVQSTTRAMAQARYHELLLLRTQGQSRWENQPSTLTVSQLNSEEILRTVRAGIAANRIPQLTGTHIPDVLDKLGLVVDGKITNAAAVLFGEEKHLLPSYTQCQLRLARFRGKKRNEFIDNRQIVGHAFTLLDEAMLFLSRHLPVAGRVEPGVFERADEPLFPPLALREALVNAICHRDYTNPGGAVSLAIFDDRLEIWSEGGLPVGITPSALRVEHPSRPRNPLLADVFFKRGLVERWGRGTITIIDLCLRAGHPEPEFEEVAGSVVVRFLPSGYIAPHQVTLDLSDRQRGLLVILAKHPALAFREIRDLVDNPPPDRTLREDLLHLKRLGLVDSEGHGRGAAWHLQNKAE